MAYELPPEVWLHVAQFIPDNAIRTLMGVNRLFFNLAMDARYRKIIFVDINEKSAMALNTLSQLADPAIAKRVRRLELPLNQLIKPYTRRSSRTYSPSSTKIRKFTTTLFYPLVSSTGPYKKPRNVSLETLIEDITKVLPLMTNLEEFHLPSGISPKPIDLQPFFTAAWAGFGRNIRILSLGGNIDGFQVLPASQPVLTALEELHLEFTDTMNLPTPNTSAAVVAADRRRTLLNNCVAPFINGLGSRLRVLKICSWSSIDMSTFFKHIGPFPILHTFSVWAVFSISFASDPSGLTQALYGVSPNLKDLTLRLHSSTHFSEVQFGDVLYQWLKGTLHNNNQFGRHLTHLQLNPPPIEAGLDNLIVFIQRSAATLMHLYVRDRYLHYPEIKSISTAFSPYTSLQSLRLNVRKLPVELLDLLAKSFPNLKNLTLRAADGQPPIDFGEQLQSHRYDDWGLWDIGIWQAGNQLEHELMLVIAQCIPSVGSFWGQGNMEDLVQRR